MDGLVRQVVAYADTDAGGIMYHGRFIELAERSRLQWILDGSQSLDSIAREHDTLLVIHKLSAIYHFPARLENEIFARTMLVKMSPARSSWQTKIFHGAQLLTTVTTGIVGVSATRMQLIRLPDALVETFSHRIHHSLQALRA